MGSRTHMHKNTSGHIIRGLKFTSRGKSTSFDVRLVCLPFNSLAKRKTCLTCNQILSHLTGARVSYEVGAKVNSGMADAHASENVYSKA